MKPSPNAPCPCGSDRKLKKCCALFHRGRPAPPHLLMRARYTAYATGAVDFIVRTTHPGGPQWRDDVAAWKAELREYCRATTFVGLRVLEHGVEQDADRAYVLFHAELLQDTTPVGFTERSLFVRANGRWLYDSAIDS